MIQEELWIERLAHDAQISYASSEKLWKAFSSQLEIRLGEEKAIDLDIAGIWSLSLVPEYIAQVTTAAEGYILVPPCLRLSMTRRANDSRALVHLSELSDAISLASGIRQERAKRWLATIAPALEEHLKNNRSVHWRHIGIWSTITEGAESCYQLEVSTSFASGLNKPFSAFSPTPISSIEGYRDLEILSLDKEPSWGGAYIVQLTPIDKPEATNTESHRETAQIQREAPALPHQIDESPGTSSVTARVEEMPISLAPETLESITSEQEIAIDTPSDLATSKSEPQQEPIATETETYPSQQRGDTPSDQEPLPPLSSEIETSNMRKPRLKLWQKCIPLILVGVLGLLYIVWQYSRPQELSTQVVIKAALPQQDSHKSEMHHTTDSTLAPDSSSISNQEQLAKAQSKEKASLTTATIKNEVNTWANSPQEMITIQDGDNLADIAKRKYGHKAFWVYIYEENRELLPAPPHAPTGQKLTLPAAKKYGIDPNNTKSVSRALILEKSLSQ